VFCLGAIALLRERAARYAALVLLIPQLAIAAYGWQHPRTLWPRGDGENRVLAALFGSVGGPDGWIPSFRLEPASAWQAAAVLLVILACVNAALVWAAPRAAADESANGWRTYRA
jgi:hypothetical protein